MTFLESTTKVYPDVTLLLNKTQLLALDKDPNEPFGDQVWYRGPALQGEGMPVDQ